MVLQYFPIEIKQKIDYLRANKTVCNQMGEKGYQYFVDNVTPFHTYSTIKRVISV